jgi:hypothetical protein
MVASHIGELALGRAAVLLAEHSTVNLCPIRHHPDEAGLLGAVQLAPSWVLDGHDAMVAADIGGTNMRAGLVLQGQGGESPSRNRQARALAARRRQADA